MMVQYTDRSISTPVMNNMEILLNAAFKNIEAGLERHNKSPNVSWDSNPYFVSPEYFEDLKNQSTDTPINESSYLYYITDKFLPADMVNKTCGSFFGSFPKHSVFCTGRFVYPKGGYMGWHTNSNHEGYRMYFTYCVEGGKSFFRYYDVESDQIITEWDNEGWNIRGFNIDKESPFWHCVWSDTTRISFGFNIKRVMK